MSEKSGFGFEPRVFLVFLSCYFDKEQRPGRVLLDSSQSLESEDAQVFCTVAWRLLRVYAHILEGFSR